MLTLVVLAGASLLLICASPALAKQPEIANVYPDFPGCDNAPRIITGEGFESAFTRIWTWSPESDEATTKKALANIDQGVPPLPARPPEGAQQHGVIDVEQQVIVARIKGAVMWVETADGFSKPLLFDVSRPFWLSESQTMPGAMVYVFGFGLRPPYSKPTIAITGRGETFYPKPIVEARALRTKDKRLVYFEVPREMKPGQYSVYTHNSIGGPWGWRKAGDLRIAAAPSGPESVFDVRDFGATGNGLANDREAIVRAIEKASDAGGGTVFFQAGIYLTDETISVPSGVQLRGADTKHCLIVGIGDPLASKRLAWFQTYAPPTSIIRLHDRTGLDSLTIQGATWKGEGGFGMVEAVPDKIEFPVGGEVRDVTIVDCCLRAEEEEHRSRRPLYQTSLFSGPGTHGFKLLNNEIVGAVVWGIGGVGPAVRVDIIGNTIHGSNDVSAISGDFSQSLIDDNRLVDTPGRLVLGMGWHNYVRFNEIHQAFRGTWENAEEVYLVHGGTREKKTIGFATGGSKNTLVDRRQDWKPGLFRDATVLVISGRGFGQYRRVIGNTEDTLTLERPWNVLPDATTEYVVSPMFTENAFFANLNNTPCRLSLWLDCVANIVELHRDDHSKGADLWGEDNSVVDEKGIAKDVTRFYPAYYNMFFNNWMDGSALWLGVKGAASRNAHKGYPIFGNLAVGNRIRQPHEHRTGNKYSPRSSAAGVMVTGGAGRAGASHTIIQDNLLASTYTGVEIGPMARKTLVLKNQFDHVDDPIEDHGIRTVVKGNVLVDGRGSSETAIADTSSERDLPEWEPPPWKPEPSETVWPLYHEVAALKVLVSQPPYCICSGVDSPQLESECRQNLQQLFAMLREYDSKKGSLPKAAFFPISSSCADGLSVLLGPKADKLLICPTCSPDLKRLKINYVWNEKISGRKLSDLKPNTWLLMDCVAAHYWMVDNHHCGHRGKVNVLYADGTVKQITPFSVDDWQISPSGTWKDWARE